MDSCVWTINQTSFSSSCRRRPTAAEIFTSPTSTRVERSITMQNNTMLIVFRVGEGTANAKTITLILASLPRKRSRHHFAGAKRGRIGWDWPGKRLLPFRRRWGRGRPAALFDEFSLFVMNSHSHCRQTANLTMLWIHWWEILLELLLLNCCVNQKESNGVKERCYYLFWFVLFWEL